MEAPAPTSLEAESRRFTHRGFGVKTMLAGAPHVLADLPHVAALEVAETDRQQGLEVLVRI